MDTDALKRLILALRERPEGVPVAGYSQEELRQLGFAIDTDRVRLPAGGQMLDAELIRSHLAASTLSWLHQLEVLPVVGSTNTLLMEMAKTQSLDGQVMLAECQVAGRGRRGRRWQSPIAANLAISLGFALERPLAELGGLSLVVGMALVDALDPTGTIGLGLKWPNDLLQNGRKLAGILVELAEYEGRTQVVVGIGVNWRLNDAVEAQIDQPAVAMSQLAPDLTRNEGAARLINQVAWFVDRFAEHGFGPLRDAYDRLHHLHGAMCNIHLGQDTLKGKIVGVMEDGSLSAEVGGVVRKFSSGEVSLRRSQPIAPSE